MITVSEATSRYSALARDRQILFLAEFGFALTVTARFTYEVQTPRVRDPERLRRLNEIQHRVLGHALALLKNDSKRYPDDVIVAIMMASEDPDPRFSDAVAYAFAGALGRVEVTARA